ncbi:MAG: hypothetical protein ACOCSL_04715 [Thermoplasmatota archaeon]
MFGSGWSIGKKIKFILLLLIFIVPIVVLMNIPELFLIVLFSVIAGSSTWYLTGKLTPFFIGIYIRLHKKFSGNPKMIAVLKNKNPSSSDVWNKVYMSLSESIFPTIIAFSIIGYILKNSETLQSEQVFLVLLFAPVIVFFVIPLKILIDSKLFYLNRNTKEVTSLGKEVNIRLKSVGGIFALALFMYTLYIVNRDIHSVFEDITIYFSFIYPTISITSLYYNLKWHRIFLFDLEEKAYEVNTPQYAVALLKE